MNKKVSKRFAVRAILVLVSLSAAVTAIGFSASGYSGTLPSVTPVDLSDPTATAEVMGFDPFSGVSSETISDLVSGDSQNAAGASSAVKATSDGIAQMPTDAPVGSDPVHLAMAQEVGGLDQTEYAGSPTGSSENSDGQSGDGDASDGSDKAAKGGKGGLNTTAVIVGGGLIVGGGVAVGLALDDDSSSSSRSSSTP